MPLRLDSQSAEFPERFRSLLAIKREAAQDVEQAVRGIVADVAARGDRALFELTAKFDRHRSRQDQACVSRPRKSQRRRRPARAQALDALKLARERIESLSPPPEARR